MCVLLSGITAQHTAPSPKKKKNCIVGSAFQDVSGKLRSGNRLRCSTLFFKSTHNPLVLFLFYISSTTASHQLLLGLAAWRAFTHSYPLTALCWQTPLWNTVTRNASRSQAAWFFGGEGDFCSIFPVQQTENHSQHLFNPCGATELHGALVAYFNHSTRHFVKMVPL